MCPIETRADDGVSIARDKWKKLFSLNQYPMLGDGTVGNAWAYVFKINLRDKEFCYLMLFDGAPKNLDNG